MEDMIYYTWLLLSTKLFMQHNSQMLAIKQYYNTAIFQPNVMKGLSTRDDLHQEQQLFTYQPNLVWQFYKIYEYMTQSFLFADTIHHFLTNPRVGKYQIFLK